MEKSLTANPAAGAGHGAGVKVHSEAGVCVELPARPCGRLESRFPDKAFYGQVKACLSPSDSVPPTWTANCRERDISPGEYKGDAVGWLR